MRTKGTDASPTRYMRESMRYTEMYPDTEGEEVTYLWVIFSIRPAIWTRVYFEKYPKKEEKKKIVLDYDYEKNTPVRQLYELCIL